MNDIRRCPLPPGALLLAYAGDNGHVDCYTCEIKRRVSHAEFVEAFYTTALFKLERWILRWAVHRPSTDAQAAQLARGEIDAFAAWSVESRTENQLLLRDLTGRTRSWLMVEPGAAPGSTRLRFGSAVVPAQHPKTGERRLGWQFRALLGFHGLYSRALLSAARSGLRSRPGWPQP